MIALKRLAGQMNLKLCGDREALISGIAEDSRAVRPGWLFVALPGTREDGRRFLDEAVARGAAAVLMSGPDAPLPVPRLIAPEARLRPLMAFIASLVHGRPSEKLILVGLTGTNGKSTVSYLMEAVLARAGLTPGVMGTINYRWPGQTRPAVNTTPEGPLLSGVLAEMAADGCRSAVLEVSSHALALGRTTGLGFEAAAFTNLSRDHLDFHKDMESYYQAKKLLFTRHLKPGGRRAAVNVDDPYGRRLAEELGDSALTFGFDPRAEVRGENLRLSRAGLSLEIVQAGRRRLQTSPLLAEINAYNILTAAALASVMRLSDEAATEALAACPGAPGRLEKIDLGDGRLVLVDYAHTPEALIQALRGARALAPPRLLALCGCGGERDKGKRPLMGRAAAEGADLVILTSDNPRAEDPEAILTAMEAGLKPLNMTRRSPGELSPGATTAGVYLKITDRRAAIAEGVRLLIPGDILLVAGKGHEDYQIVGREKKHLDDRQEARRALEASKGALCGI